jgi:hypothetical protein
MSISHMSSRSFKSAVLFTVLSLPVVLSAQTSSSEEERLQKLLTDSTQWYVPKTTVSIGFRLLTSGGNVRYGNLGRVDTGLDAVPPASAGIVTRVYNNGTVGADAVRASEKDANGNQIAPDVNGRYQTFATVTAADGTTSTVQTGDYLSYVAGLARGWTYASASQVTADGRIGFSTYHATSNGGSAMKDTAGSGGVDFQVTRAFGKFSSRTEWGLTAGIALNGINNKTSGSVLSTLHTDTDFYSLNGKPAPTAPYDSTTAQVDFTNSQGTVYPNSLETTVPLAALPGSSTSSQMVGGTTVNGNWQVKGAYFLMRIGPSVRAQLTQRLGLSASLGVAGAYTGSTYSVIESFAAPDSGGAIITTPDPEKSSTSEFLSGYYADINLDWAVSERTGFFGGLSAQQLGDYDQVLNGRTAHIDLGNSVGVRGGISIKF